MKNKYKPKKNRRVLIKKTQKIKSYGGAIEENNIPSQNILEEIREKRNLLSNQKTSELLEKAENLAEGVAVNTFEKVGDLVGVDITNPEETKQKLDQIKANITNPENVEKIKEIAENIAEVGSVALEASKPFIDPLIDETISKGSEAASKIGENGVKILLNTAEEIPGVGVLIGTIRSASNAGEAIMATANAASEIATTASDTINASTKNFNKLIKEKGDLLERTKRSISDFTKPNLMKGLEQKESLNNSQFTKIVGGKSKKRSRKYKNKTKRN